MLLYDKYLEENRVMLAREGAIKVLADLSTSEDEDLQWQVACALCNIACALGILLIANSRKY